LPLVTERVEAFLRHTAAPLTVFVVGKDLELSENRDAVSRLFDAGCELANHSHNHYPWLETLAGSDLESEVAEAEVAIEQLTGVTPVGFRAPGFSWSPILHEILARRGYQYDSSMFPTSIGPLASWYVRLTRRKTPKSDSAAPDQQFASLRDSFRTLRPHDLSTPAGPLVELPVTTMPLARTPIHVTYLTFLAQKSPRLASAYLAAAIRLCRMRGVAPVMLLHPLDFLGPEDEPELSFFPGMKLGLAAKQALLVKLVEKMRAGFELATTGRQASAWRANPQPHATDAKQQESAPAATV